MVNTVRVRISWYWVPSTSSRIWSFRSSGHYQDVEEARYRPVLRNFETISLSFLLLEMTLSKMHRRNPVILWRNVVQGIQECGRIWQGAGFWRTRTLTLRSKFSISSICPRMSFLESVGTCLVWSWKFWPSTVARIWFNGHQIKLGTRYSSRTGKLPNTLVWSGWALPTLQKMGWSFMGYCSISRTSSR
jgi:hypothetical protein